MEQQIAGCYCIGVVVGSIAYFLVEYVFGMMYNIPIGLACGAIAGILTAHIVAEHMIAEVKAAQQRED